jgi:mono/diheme cytochrome c family protein
VALATALTGCRKEDMAEQPRYSPYQPSAFFEDGSSARPLVEGTVTRSGGQSDGYEFYRSPMSTTAPSAAASVHNGETDVASADFPQDFPRNGEDLRRALERGRERFNIYCSVCHGETGAGDGMIVQRGFIKPPAFYPLAKDQKADPDLYRREQNLVAVPPGYIVDKITNGYGAMFSYAARVAPADRWAIAAYVRVLQSSQMANLTDLAEQDRSALSKAATQPSGGTTR